MRQHLPSLTMFLLICFAVAAFGAQFKPGAWYAALLKPDWTPPSWLFPPVWTLLYLMIAVAGWLIWRRRGLRDSAGAFSLYALQLLLNGLWSWLFFGLHRPDWAFLDIAALWAAILANLVAFHRISPAAGFLLAPYLLWVSYAAALNWALWRLNLGTVF